MKTTLDIPDAMYRRIKVRSAREGRTVRSVTLVLFSQWLGDRAPSLSGHRVPGDHAGKPAWFGSVKVDPRLPHDMESVRESIAKRMGVQS